MSTVGSQANELRKRAKVLRQGDWSDGADDAALMEQAADTIESMQDRLQATSETCHWEYPQGVNGWVGYIVCSACGHQFSGVDEREWTCCPCCRREIKEVDA